MLTDTRKSPFAKVSPLATQDVEWTDGFWKETVNRCSDVTVAHLRNMFESEKISHVVENFRICADPADMRPHDGTVFGDGDFYKWMESALYSAVANHDEQLLADLDSYIELIGHAQQPDGYLSTKQIIAERTGVGKRLGDINEFEVYNMGHLFTSACLHKRLTGKDNFLHIAEKAADYLAQMYQEAREKDEVMTAVCPSHYMGLIEMYRTTGEKKYLDLARLAVELRDSVKNGLDDNQDRLPLKKHRKIVGHAVRATYLYAGVADLYAEEGDREYLDMLHRVWDNMVSTKVYITGGIGALYNGASPYGYFFQHDLIHQAFGYEYQLPNVTAYNETCASIGLVFWAYRMFLIEPKAEYMDLLERAMLNVNLAAVSLDGERFFYENMLRRAKKLSYRLIWRLRRAKYILSYCCPPNLARTIAQSSEYLYTVSGNRIYLGLYGASRAKVAVDGLSFTLIQQTQYPYDGKIVLKADDVQGEGVCEVMVRIPSWVQSGAITVRGQQVALSEADAGTYRAIRMNPSSDEVEIFFAMPVRFTCAHPMVEECAGQVAVERGPLVYCMETPDAPCSLDNIVLDPGERFEVESYQIGDRTVEALSGSAYQIHNPFDGEKTLYKTAGQQALTKIPVRLIPYFAWDNRGALDDGTYDVYSIEDKLDTPDDMVYDEMRIWFPVAYRV